MICLSGQSTFFTIDGADQPMFWPPNSVRDALKPSGAGRVTGSPAALPGCRHISSNYVRLM